MPSFPLLSSSHITCRKIFRHYCKYVCLLRREIFINILQFPYLLDKRGAQNEITSFLYFPTHIGNLLFFFCYYYDLPSPLQHAGFSLNYQFTIIRLKNYLLEKYHHPGEKNLEQGIVAFPQFIFLIVRSVFL